MLRYLFTDMNAYFASCEQQDHPELRGRPVAVVPVADTERTCCIAVSYEAKARGIKTGCAVSEARRLCPGLVLALSNPRRYIEIHHAILEAVDTVIPVNQVRSIDEFDCKLLGTEREADRAVELARSIKMVIKRKVGETLRCSVGIAPNVWLAKVASNLRKPDGLTVVPSSSLPDILFPLDLEDLPGIGKNMGKRLRRAGVYTIENLYALSSAELTNIWGSRIHGIAWYGRLRGEDVREQETRTRSAGHSRTLAPNMRNDDDARAVLVSLIHKAAARMRAMGYWSYLLVVYADHVNGPTWRAKSKLSGCRDTGAFIRRFGVMWPKRPKLVPIRVGVVLDHLQSEQSVASPLFAGQRKDAVLADTMDRINDRFGRSSIYFAGMHQCRSVCATRISFSTVPDLSLPDA